MATSKLQSLVHFLRLYRQCSSPNNLKLQRDSSSTSTLAAGASSFRRYTAFKRLLQLSADTPNQIRSSRKFTNSMATPGQQPPEEGSSNGVSKPDDGEPPPLPPLPPAASGPPSPPSGPFKSGWMRWALGAILSLVLSFGFPRWATLLRIGGQAEVVMEEVEHTAEVMEKVANVAEKVSEEMADQLPDQSKLKQAALFVENVSKEASKDARFVEEFIHEVDKVKHDLGDVEKLAEPVITAIIEDIKSHHGGNQS